MRTLPSGHLTSGPGVEATVRKTKHPFVTVSAADGPK